jgi:hypothetical protein
MSTTNIGTYILPDTAIAAATTDEIIFTYFQLYSGQLIENVSPDGKNWETTIIDVTSWETVKLFTPLAAVAFGQLGGKRVSWQSIIFLAPQVQLTDPLIYSTCFILTTRMSSTTWSTMGHSPTRKANGEWETLKN